MADRKSTRLNSSHITISYAVFCLKKKKRTQIVDEPHRCNYYMLSQPHINPVLNTLHAPTQDSFVFNDTATTEIYTLSLHDALPISPRPKRSPSVKASAFIAKNGVPPDSTEDRKSTRLNSSHITTSYAVFCLKK